MSSHATKASTGDLPSCRLKMPWHEGAPPLLQQQVTPWDFCQDRWAHCPCFALHPSLFGHDLSRDPV